MPKKKKSSRRSYSRRDSSDYDSESSYSSRSRSSDSRDRYSRDDSRGRYHSSRDRDRHHASRSRDDRYSREGSRARDDRYYREGSRARDDHHSPRRRRSSREERSRDRSYHKEDSHADEDRRGSSGSRRSSYGLSKRRSSSNLQNSSDNDDEDYDRNERSRARNEERRARKAGRRPKKGGKRASRGQLVETNLQVQQRRNNNHLAKAACLPIGDNMKLKKMLEEEGLSIVDMSSDGNCLFRSVSDQLYNDRGHHHDEVRSDICDFMAQKEDEFSMFLAFEKDGKTGSRDAKDYESYIADTRRDGVWGGNLELVAAARMYRRNITVYNSTLSVFTIECDCEETSGPDMLLSFHSGDHYNSVRANAGNKKYSRGGGKSSRKLTRNGSGGSSRRSLSDTATTSATSASTISVSPPIAGNYEPLQDTNIVVATVVGIDDVPIKKNAQCPCGSGKRYKRCCWAKLKNEKKEERRKKDRRAHGHSRSPSRPRGGTDDDATVSSGFKVLQI